MLRILLLMLAGMLLVAGADPATAGPGCGDYGRCFELTIKNSLPVAATFSVRGENCYEGQGGRFPLQPGQTAAIGIARVQGHGCNGHQGYFTLLINNNGTGQGFQFDNSDGLAFNGVSNKYYSVLSGATTTPGGWKTYTWSVRGMWNNPPVCDSGRCFPLFVKNSLSTAITWKLIAGDCYEGNRPSPFTVQPGQSYQFSLARVQGHGCNGHQGKFGLQPVGSFNNEVQWFDFSNDGGLELTNAAYMYAGQLARMDDVNGAYRWDVNATNGSNTPVAGCGDKARCFWVNLANRSSASAVFVVGTGSCYEGTTGTYTIPAGQQQKIGIARIQGHGCDGRQGNFTVAIDGKATSALNFSNDAGLAFSNSNTVYDVVLGTRSKTDDGWLWYDLVLNGQWQNPQICDSARCFQLFVSNALATPVTWKLNPINCYQGTLPGQFTVQAGSRYQIALARVQGHGCDGKQGEFGLQPVGVLAGETQNLNFSNDGGLALTNTPKGYLAILGKKDSDNAYTYTVDENITHKPGVIASTTGNWNTSSIKLFNFTTDGYWPNFYQACVGYEAYHNQHVVRLPNDAAGNAYFIVAQSREHNGYITLLKVAAAQVDRTNDAIVGADGAVVGKAIWQQVYTGTRNGTIDPVGNWNHPGKMSYMDGVLVVAAQNWDIGGLKVPCGYWYNAVGTSEDKVLFYDFRNVSSPRYLGAITAGELSVSNHELATVELAYDSLASKYLLNAGGDGKYPVLAANVLNPSIGNWTRVPGGPVFSGQHGLAFDTTIDGATKLFYFDAGRSDGGKGKFSFTPYAFSASPPYLTGGTTQEIPVSLPGANRDWDASSIYISPLTRKPIVYTVKSLDGTSNYQLYQVLPGN